MGSSYGPPPEVIQQAMEKQNEDKFNQAADKQAKSAFNFNRPNQTNAFGASSQWTQNPDGTYSQKQSFGGPLGGLATNLQNQAAGAMGTPFDLKQFGTPGNGDQARDQAIQSAYGQATSRLDPQWNQREEAQRTQLLNQGLDPSSEAYRNAMGEMGRERNDAYSSAMNGAIGQGTAAGSAAFQNNMLSHQQAIADYLRQRGGALGELGQMGGMLGQDSFQGVQGTQNLSALLGATNLTMQQQQAMEKAKADQMAGFSDLLGAGAGLAGFAVGGPAGAAVGSTLAGGLGGRGSF